MSTRTKMYKSQDGCCICRVKSSSSRFTSSNKYEPTFEKCFSLSEQRFGDICNACVLLVKRFRKLPEGTQRHWNHVVDARSATAGVRSMTKAKKIRPPPMSSSTDGSKRVSSQPAPVPSAGSSSSVFSNSSSSSSSNSINNNENSSSKGRRYDDIDDFKRKHVYKSKRPRKPRTMVKEAANRKQLSKNVQRLEPGVSVRTGGLSIFCLSGWRKQKICCGQVFVGPKGEVGLEAGLLRRCEGCRVGGTRPYLPANIMSPNCNVDVATILPDLILRGSGGDALDPVRTAAAAPTTTTTTTTKTCSKTLLGPRDASGGGRQVALIVGSILGPKDAATAAAPARYPVPTAAGGQDNGRGESDEEFFDKQVVHGRASPTSSSGTVTPPPPATTSSTSSHPDPSNHGRQDHRHHHHHHHHRGHHNVVLDRLVPDNRA